ncbi:alkaline phosphatase D family protein [Micromonospora sp. NPDC048999]|uniref:alkaline phosphatase D family protein n=1 Tax=Micromonospora sp. NPDC048999 TaxID=3155391 RepID=UPI0033EC1D34
MTVVNAWVGAVTPTSFRVVTKITGTAARLAVATNSGLTNPTYYGPVTATAQGIASLTASGLSPNKRYWWGISEDGGAVPKLTSGQCRTFPVTGEPASFSFIASGDAGHTPQYPGIGSVLASSRQSNHPVFDTIRQQDPLFFAHLGDLHYYDLGSGKHGISGGASMTNYRRAIDDVLLQQRQHDLYRNVPLVYIYDDHDYGPNDSDRTAPGRANVMRTYRERVPHYPLPSEDGIFHSFQVGRVLFVAADSRANRDPNSTKDGPAKTMLGSAQIAWLEQLLSRSSASALCWLMQVQWISGFEDSWGGFRYEQGELKQLLGDTGWLDRMWMINADKHALGIDTGTNNRWGRFPIFLSASLDAGGSDNTGNYDRGVSGGRNRYTTFNVQDQGDRITVTGTAMIGKTPWRAHTFSILVSTPPPSPGPDPAPEPDPEFPPAPPLSPATLTDRIEWLGCDLVSGRVIAELPDLTGTVSRVLGAYTSSSLSMPIPTAGPAALGSLAIQATQPGVTMIVCVANGVPVWGGIVLVRDGGTDADLRLGCVSLEGYLDARYVGDHTWAQRDEVRVIAAGLAGDAMVEGIGLDVDARASGVLRDRSYTGRDDATVYSRLRELMAVEGGPEWTIDVDWADAAKTRVAKILRVGKRIGVAAGQAQPRAVWTSGGASDLRYRLSEDYSNGKGANHVVATSSGEGDERPQSAPARDILPGWPRWERRWSPSSSITEQSTLDAHARSELALRRDGAVTVSLDTRFSAYPRLGLDWRLGDDGRAELQGHRHPGGLVRTGRIIGWELDTRAGRARPILWGGGDSWL